MGTITDCDTLVAAFVCCAQSEVCRPARSPRARQQVNGRCGKDAVRHDSQVMPMSDINGQDWSKPEQPATSAGVEQDFAQDIVRRLFSVGLSLESARSIIGGGAAGDRLAAATDEIDGIIRHIRSVTLSRAASRPANSADQVARMARRLQERALEFAGQLEQQAEHTRPPVRLDYPAEIKRWRAFADQAEQTAIRWEGPP